jgi:hypothetical protein
MTASYDPNERPFAPAPRPKKKQPKWLAITAIIGGVVLFVGGSAILMDRSPDSAPSGGSAGSISDDDMQAMATPCNQAFASFFDVAATGGAGADHAHALNVTGSLSKECLAATRKLSATIQDNGSLCAKGLRNVSDRLGYSLQEAGAAHVISERMDRDRSSLPDNPDEIPTPVREALGNTGRQYVEVVKEVSISYTRFAYEMRECGHMPVISGLLDKETITAMGQTPPEGSSEN